MTVRVAPDPSFTGEQYSREHAEFVFREMDREPGFSVVPSFGAIFNARVSGFHGILDVRCTRQGDAKVTIRNSGAAVHEVAQKLQGILALHGWVVATEVGVPS